jgi:hypothetical protein
MKGAGEREIVRRWLQLTRLAPASELGSLRTVALLFAELAGCRPVWQEELEGWTVTESPLLNSWLQQAADRKALEQGREWLLDCLRTRFPADLTPEVIATINQQPSVALLHDWYKAALTASTSAEFLAALRQ